ncbi:MAG: energy transducer TonB [Candidatus Sulfotelmatobacter sp.]|jgi:TonB family protein
MGTHQILQQSSVADLARPQAGAADEQPRRLQIALALLLIALAFVIVKDRDFWFGSDDAIESDATNSQPIQNTAAAVPAKAAEPLVAGITAVKNHVSKKTATTAVTEPSHQGVAQSDSPLVVGTRAAVPPLDVEVIAGDNHRTVHPGSNVTKVEIPNDSNRVSSITSATLTTNAAEHERLTASSFSGIPQTVDATYPLLGQHMRVQGSVVLQAVIGTDGNIEDLRVLSGPAILTAAAQQAVRQWRFKPYLQNGQPVETKARITVNFSIRIADDSANAS